jgi:hypothetical protein
MPGWDLVDPTMKGWTYPGAAKALANFAGLQMFESGK